MKLFHYFRAGQIERGRDYHWCDGYSRVTETGYQFPWLTKREAQMDARRDGGKAVFHETLAEAHESLQISLGKRHTPKQIEAAQKALTTLAAFWRSERDLEGLIGRDVDVHDIEDYVPSSDEASNDDAIALLNSLKAKRD